MDNNLPEQYNRVLNLLSIGAENAVTGSEICRLIGCTRTNLRKMVSDLVIKYGYKIGSSSTDNPGYFIISNEDELNTALRNLTGRRAKLNERINALKNSTPKGQMKINVKALSDSSKEI